MTFSLKLFPQSTSAKTRKISLQRALIFISASLSGINCQQFEPQPTVTIVERKPRRSSSGSLSMPDGSPWCDSKPSIWVVGSQEKEEAPLCQHGETGVWEVLSTTKLDPLSSLINCCHLDADGDGVEDIVCLGEDGKNTLYITQEDGSLQEVYGHGIQNFSGQTKCVVLEVSGTPAVFITVDANDENNKGHRIFKLIQKRTTNDPFFEEVGGPWTNEMGASCVVVADVNNDGLDDIVLCRKGDFGKMFIQYSDGNDSDGSFQEVQFGTGRAKNWRSVRVADLNGDGYPDLLTLKYSKNSTLRVFKGIKDFPFFTFETSAIIYEQKLGFGANDLAVLDANNDGHPDIYVALIDESTAGGYCKRDFKTNKWWGPGLEPPDNFVPPRDEAHDNLFLGKDTSGGGEAFERIAMLHEEPGCGFFVENFGHDLLLAQGTPLQPGPNLLLQWIRSQTSTTTTTTQDTTTTTATRGPATFQPTVTTIEKNPSRKNFISMSMPGGSPWCGDDRPTVWFTGHQATNESPWCQNKETGAWELSSNAVLDFRDELNNGIDRHSCCHLDVNRDGLEDVVCLVGAYSGRGEGHNELYLTQGDGSLKKVLQGHGLQKYPTMRTRYCAVLNVSDTPAVIIAVRGAPRKDKKENEHRMFKLVEERNVGDPFFEEVAPDQGPWIKNTRASCVRVFDFNKDGLDDFVLCNEIVEANIFIQKPNGSFEEVKMGNSHKVKNWRNVRAADIDYDEIPDLIVVDYGKRSARLRIFKGLGKPPFFDFSDKGMIYQRQFPSALPDVEVLDVNNDGWLDLYVIRLDEVTVDSYCGPPVPIDRKKWWGESIAPPRNFVPPLDRTRDVLLLGQDPKSGGELFQEIEMEHEEPGCGWLADKFGDDGMLLAQGTHGRPGPTLHLQWNV